MLSTSVLLLKVQFAGGPAGLGGKIGDTVDDQMLSEAKIKKPSLEDLVFLITFI